MRHTSLRIRHPVDGVARYLRYRVHLFSAATQVSAGGELISHLSRRCPDGFDITPMVSEDQTCRDDWEVRLIVTSQGQQVDLTWRGEGAEPLVRWLTEDPVWGPDWDLAGRLHNRTD
jgi:hypothetical protein